MMDLVDLFELYRIKDQEALAAVGPLGRANQLRLRLSLRDFVALQWDWARIHGLKPARQLEWEGVGAMADFLAQFADSAAAARRMAGDPPISRRHLIPPPRLPLNLSAPRPWVPRT